MNPFQNYPQWFIILIIEGIVLFYFLQVDLDTIVSAYAVLDFNILCVDYFSYFNPIIFDFNLIRSYFHFSVVSSFFHVLSCCFGSRGLWFSFVFRHVIIWLYRSWNCIFDWNLFLGRDSVLFSWFSSLGLWIFLFNLCFEGLLSQASLRNSTLIIYLYQWFVICLQFFYLHIIRCMFVDIYKKLYSFRSDWTFSCFRF